MDCQIKYFCELIKNVIHKKDNNVVGHDVDWSYMVQLAKDHGLFPLFVEQATQYTAYLERQEYAIEMQETFSTVAAQIKRTNAFLRLYCAFVQEGIYPIVMKGLICRELYGELCDHRPSADEDILIRKEEYWKAKEILIENGYVAEFSSETEAQLEKVQEISFFHPKERLQIELHLNILGRENNLRSQMTDCFKEVFENYRTIEKEGVTLRTMDHQEHLLFLIFHAFKHFTTGGFGLRQLLDIMLYQQKYGAEIDVQNLQNTLCRFKADVFWSDLVHLANTYLGFDLPALQEPNCPEQLLEDMILCGSFGNKTQAERTAMETTIAMAGNHWEKKSRNIVTIIWLAIFPSKATMINYFPYLQEKPWMLPVEWVKRWGRFLKHNRENKRNLALASIKVSRRRAKILKKYDLA